MEDKPAGAGRPASFSRESAIDRAMQLFWSEGYLAVTAKELAEAMGIQRSSFYNSFGDRESVFSEALEAYVRQAPDGALEAIGAGEPVLPAIVECLRDLCRARSADPRGCLVCNSVAELVGVDTSLGPFLEEAIRRRTDRMRALFRQAVEQGELEPAADPTDLANAFMTFLLGINLASKSIRTEAELWSICRYFLRGIEIDVDRYAA